jgi:hypothetical protein
MAIPLNPINRRSKSQKSQFSPLTALLFLPKILQNSKPKKRLCLSFALAKLLPPKKMNNILIGVDSVFGGLIPKENSVDYLFTDPPFGGNIIYYYIFGA